jgi:hypothetical protein
MPPISHERYRRNGCADLDQERRSELSLAWLCALLGAIGRSASLPGRLS